MQLIVLRPLWLTMNWNETNRVPWDRLPDVGRIAFHLPLRVGNGVPSGSPPASALPINRATFSVAHNSNHNQLLFPILQFIHAGLEIDRAGGHRDKTEGSGIRQATIRRRSHLYAIDKEFKLITLRQDTDAIGFIGWSESVAALIIDNIDDLIVLRVKAEAPCAVAGDAHVVKLLGLVPADHEPKAILPAAVRAGDGRLKIGVFHFGVGGVPAAPVGRAL